MRVTRWLSLLARVVLAGVWLVAGASKVSDLAASVRAVHAYDLLPYAASKVVGVALPFVELALGLLLLAGFATRLAAGLSTGLQLMFVAGISAAWARGLRIDCGCFGGGGELGAGESPNYFWDLIRDIALLAASGYLIWRPRSPFALDNALDVAVDGHADDDDDDDDDDLIDEDEIDGEEAHDAGPAR
jgi:uncharacterized membrane protein YphA (DoxX/SURF4 family)